MTLDRIFLLLKFINRSLNINYVPYALKMLISKKIKIIQENLLLSIL